ncbi:transglycosylase domain-containing protein [bacterium]|nr:transglycosylase domain-containing protein [bacterium]
MHRLERLSRYLLLIRRLFIAGFIAGSLLFVVYLCFFELESPLPTLMILDCHDRVICEVRDGDENAEAGYWPVHPVPPRVAATVQAVEDHRFYWHPGVDPIAIIRAITQNFRNGYRVSGASTIAMQVARLQRPAARTYGNKLKESIDAIAMTIRIGRTGVMDHYLRVAPYGNGIRGLGYAARYYFDKPIDDLSWAEIAFLSAIPQQPNSMNPRTASGRVRIVRQGRQILDTVYQQGLMTEYEYLRARDQVAHLVLCRPYSQSLDTIHLAIRFRKIFKDVNNRNKLQGPRVRTAIDLDIQEMVAEENRLCVKSWSVSGARNGAVMVIDSGTREIISLVGSTDYFDEQKAGAIDYTDVLRSPGSTLKPFIYALAMDQGTISPDSFLADDVQHAVGFRNFDRVYLGRIPVRKALASSRNVPAVYLLKQTGVYRTYGCFADLNLHNHETDCDRYGLGMAIGGLPVTMEMLARAYTVFTNRGNLGKLHWFRSDSMEDSRSIFSEKTVSWINEFLADPLARLPSFPRMGYLEYSYPVAVKTGTSEGCRDAWAVAWTSRYTVLTWLGRPDGQLMHGVSGYRTAADLAHVIMDNLHKNTESKMFWLSAKVKNEKQINKSTPVNRKTSINITSPEDGALYYFDPEVPDSFSTILLTVDISDETATRVTWEIDGTPLHTVNAPFISRWKMTSGIHQIRVSSVSDPDLKDAINLEIRDVR